MNLIAQGSERSVVEPVRSGRLVGTGTAPPPDIAALLDPFRLFAILRRRIRLIAVVAAAVFLAIAIPTFTAPRLYQATALVVLDQRQAQITPADQQVLSALPDKDTNVVDTEVEVLKSRQLAEHVMDKLSLDADPEFGGDPAAAAAADSQARRGAPGGPVVYSADEQARRSAVIDALEGALQVERIGLTYMMSIGFESQSPAKAARIADTFASEYIGQQLDAKFDARRQANNWLGAKLQQMQGEVVRAETAVEQYKIAHNLMSSSGATLTEQEVSQYSQQMTDARTQQAEAEAKLAAARSQLASGDTGGALDSPLLRDLRTKRGEVSAKLADYSARFGAKYPDTISANRQLADIDSQIQGETNRVLADLEGQAAVARQRTNSIASSLNSARGSLAGSNRASVGLEQLQSEADSVRTLYEGLLARYKETSSEAGIEQSDARLVSSAAIPTAPASPNVPINLALAFVAAMAAAAVAVAIAELLDTSFGTGEEIERRLGMAHLGSIPDLTSMGTTEQPHIYITTRPLSAFAEAFRSLRTTLLQAGRARPPKTVAIASALPGEGKTIAAVCLAKSAAQAGDKVAVIDCDLRRRKLSTSLGIKPTVGLLEVLAGKADLDAALVYDSSTGVGILPLTSEEVTPEDVFGSEAMRNLLDQLGARFDLVVLDTAPILALADTRTLIAQVDAIVMLTRWRRTPQKAVEHAIRLLRGAEDRLAGIMLSQVNMSQQRQQGYGDAAYYSGAYEKYYMG